MGRYSNQNRETERILYLCEKARSENVSRSEPTSRRAAARLSVQQNDLLVQRYEAGARPVDIARELGVTEWTIHNRLKRLGVRRRPIGMSKQQIEEAVRLRTSGVSFRKIGQQLRFSADTVQRRIMDHEK